MLTICIDYSIHSGTSSSLLIVVTFKAALSILHVGFDELIFAPPLNSALRQIKYGRNEVPSMVRHLFVSS